MLDRYGRVINYLRISVTDRCNLRCCYCMPEGVQDVGMKNILTFEEIWEIVRTGVSLGITHIRITGGEPLVRKGCVNLIRGIREIPGVETITMTTNGVLLGNYAKQLKEAGVDGVNISLDTLDPEEFFKITGKRELQEVLAGIRAAKTAGLPVKLNAVNRKELDPIPLVRYAQEENLPIRFIEMMPVGYGKKYVGRSNEELRETLEAVCGNAECMTNREELSRMFKAVCRRFSENRLLHDCSQIFLFSFAEHPAKILPLIIAQTQFQISFCRQSDPVTGITEFSVYGTDKPNRNFQI